MGNFKFKKVERFGENRVNEIRLMKVGSLYGFINLKGEWVIEPKYKDAYEFSEGLAYIRDEDESQYFINEAGEKIVEFGRSKIGRYYKNGLLDIRINRERGYVNKNKELIIPMKFCMDSLSEFISDYLVIVSNKKKGVINKSGEVIISPKYDSMMRYTEGLFPVKKNGKWGYINEKDELKIDFQYEEAVNFSEGLAEVTINGKVGFINKENEFVIEPKFSKGMPDHFWGVDGFKEGMCCIRMIPKKINPGMMAEEDNLGYINLKGELVIEPQFNYGQSFSEGLAGVIVPFESGELSGGYIDNKGNFIIKPVFDTVSSFENGVAMVTYNGEWGYIKKDSSFIYKPKGFDLW